MPDRQLGWGRAIAIGLGIVVLCVAYQPATNLLRPVIMRGACLLTGCAPTAMVAVGWALMVLAVCLFAAALECQSRGSRAVGITLHCTGAALTYLALLIGNSHTGTTSELVGGYGRDMARGVGTALLALFCIPAGLGILALVARAFRRSLSTRTALVLTGAAALGVLALAVDSTRAAPAPAARLLPETFTAAGDTLRRTGSAEQRGCAQVMANQGLLGGCLHTVKATYTTDDSDAVVHLAAVLFHDAQEATEVRRRLPTGSGQQGIPGDVRTTAGTAGAWVLLGSVRHADSRRIADDADEGHLLWALRQVQYRFIGNTQDNPAPGGPREPSPSPPIVPVSP